MHTLPVDVDFCEHFWESLNQIDYVELSNEVFPQQLHLEIVAVVNNADFLDLFTEEKKDFRNIRIFKKKLVKSYTFSILQCFCTTFDQLFL